jgi:hypothetical protein
MAAIPYDDMLMNNKLKKKSSTTKQSKKIAQPIEREFIELAREIYTYYPEMLIDKEMFISHISEYIKKGLQDFRNHFQSKIPHSNIDLNVKPKTEIEEAQTHS